MALIDTRAQAEDRRKRPRRWQVPGRDDRASRARRPKDDFDRHTAAPRQRDSNNLGVGFADSAGKKQQNAPTHRANRKVFQILIGRPGRCGIDFSSC
jgi:hypothetical protein